ncbi:MAG TPA: VapC toxin family PIN domain ribonuclease [Planktothrix sp. UBA8407]|jgi:Predicted nucleic acid-binding protein, contains PIN domain|nr:VapC toxin family PIN domain ribonuclease [Planktothrix sp. UBA8402]HAO10825.1 VapC toxin family PIN domain ribonuclease [Planktothrix sp. UBA8407]HBK22125.1 VapC toxin family PIN domain ribonuclease [Planktothrix sp. UBA10369]
MKYLLDTNICIYIIKKNHQSVLDKFQSLTLGEIGISAITVAELEYGVYKSQKQQQNRKALATFLIPLQIISYDIQATQVYAQLRGELEKKGTVIGAMDMLIASQAISLQVTLVTNNLKEFSRIPNLLLENWA